MFSKCVKINNQIGKSSSKQFSSINRTSLNSSKSLPLFNAVYRSNFSPSSSTPRFSFQKRQNYTSPSLLQTSSSSLSFSSKNLFFQPKILKNNEDNENNDNNNNHSTGNWKYIGFGIAFAVGFALFALGDENEAEEQKENLIWKIVLTGGPCGGKSTAMSAISQRLKSLGYDVYIVPEVATIVISGGLSFLGLSNEQFMSIETSILRLQEFLEDTFTRMAQARGKPSVILCDRGLCDNKAYLPKGSFDILLDEEGLKITDIRDKRYDAVFHLVTAAIGAEEFYTLANNTARSETPEEARQLDYKVLDSWVGHPKLKIIDNSSDFKTKINRVVDGICRIVGAPSLLGFERKFKVNTFSIPPDITTETFDVDTDVIILDDGSQARLMKRTQKGSSTYVYTSQSNLSGHEAVVERQITGREYLALRKQVQSHHQTVTKRITHFVWEGLYYSLNEYTSPRDCAGTKVLEVETSSKDHKFTPPPFIYLGDEITNDEKYSTYAFAMKKE